MIPSKPTPTKESTTKTHKGTGKLSQISKTNTIMFYYFSGVVTNTWLKDQGVY